MDDKASKIVWHLDRNRQPLELMEWANKHRDPSYRFIRDERVGEFRVVTIWDGINHYGSVDPEIFFCAVFYGEKILREAAFKTEAEALARHAAEVKECQESARG